MKDRSGNGTPGMEQQSEQDICAHEVSNAECSSQGIRGGSENNNNNKNSANQKLKKKNVQHYRGITNILYSTVS